MVGHLIKIYNSYYALRILEVNENYVKWQHVNGSDNYIGESKRINAPLGTYFSIHDALYRVEDFSEEVVEFIPNK